VEFDNNDQQAILVHKITDIQSYGKEITEGCRIKRESGYLYFIDSDGDISRAVMRKAKLKRF
jgi:hypothetical protein